jgi:hypothetical protein
MEPVEHAVIKTLSLLQYVVLSVKRTFMPSVAQVTQLVLKLSTIISIQGNHRLHDLEVSVFGAKIAQMQQ